MLIVVAPDLMAVSIALYKKSNSSFKTKTFRKSKFWNKVSTRKRFFNNKFQKNNKTKKSTKWFGLF